MRSGTRYLFVIKSVIMVSFLTLLVGGCEESVKIANTKPVIEGVEKDVCYVEKGGAVNFSVTAFDADGDRLSYRWRASGGSFDSFTDEGAGARWVAPQQPGEYAITIEVTDEIDKVSTTIYVDVCDLFPTTVEADTVISDPGYKFILKKIMVFSLLFLPVKKTYGKQRLKEQDS